MGAPRRTKATAGAGLAAMILGALLVVAPTSAGAEDLLESPPVIDVIDGKVDVCHRTNSTSNPYRSASLSVEGANPSNTNDHTSHGGLPFDPSATYPTPRKDAQWGDIVPAYTVGGVYFEGLNWTTATHLIWSNECAAVGTQPEAQLTLVKAVTGEIPEDGWSFDFTVDNDVIDPVEVTLAGAATDTEASTDPALALSPGTYDVTELSGGAADFVSWSCTRDGEQEPFSSSTDDEDLDAQLTLANGDAVTCTFTNDFPTGGEPQATVTVIKNVTGVVPANWTAGVSVDDAGEAAPVVVPLAGTSAAVQDTDTVTVQPGTYTVSETNSGGGTLTSGSCTDDAAASGAPALWVWSPQAPAAPLNLEGDQAVTCTFTNNYTATIIPDPDPVPASLEVVKVAGGGVPAGQWSVDFDLTGPSADEDFELRRDDPSESFTGLAAGTYTITETRPTGDLSVLTDVTCLAGTTELTLVGSGDARTVTLAEAADVTCTFTNTYPEVRDTTVTVPPSTTPPSTTPPTTAAPSPTTAAPAAQPAEQVLGQTVVRSLPRTGSETRDLAGLGAALLAMGAALVIASNKRTSTIS